MWSLPYDPVQTAGAFKERQFSTLCASLSPGCSSLGFLEFSVILLWGQSSWVAQATSLWDPKPYISLVLRRHWVGRQRDWRDQDWDFFFFFIPQYLYFILFLFKEAHYDVQVGVGLLGSRAPPAPTSWVVETKGACNRLTPLSSWHSVNWSKSSLLFGVIWQSDYFLRKGIGDKVPPWGFLLNTDCSPSV